MKNEYVVVDDRGVRLKSPIIIKESDIGQMKQWILNHTDLLGGELTEVFHDSGRDLIIALWVDHGIRSLADLCHITICLGIHIYERGYDEEQFEHIVGPWYFCNKDFYED